MQEFLAEVYIPRSAPVTALSQAQVASVADEISRQGRPVRLLRAIFVPEDETCFFHFEGQSAELIHETVCRAGLRTERVVQAESHQGAPT